MFRRACQTFGLGRVGFILQAHNNIPQARGMGSSAEAIVAGIAAAAAFAQDDDLNRDAVFELAAPAIHARATLQQHRRQHARRQIRSGIQGGKRHCRTPMPAFALRHRLAGVGVRGRPAAGQAADQPPGQEPPGTAQAAAARNSARFKAS